MWTSRPSTRTRAPVGPSRTRSFFQVFASFSAAISARQKSVRLVLMPRGYPKRQRRADRARREKAGSTAGLFLADLGRDELHRREAARRAARDREAALHLDSRPDDDAGIELREPIHEDVARGDLPVAERRAVRGRRRGKRLDDAVELGRPAAEDRRREGGRLG